MRSGKQLIEDIDSCSVNYGELGIWWLGQHSFIVKAGATIIYLDPFLSPRPDRQVAPFLSPEIITHADYITGSHDHSDHIDRPIWPILAQTSVSAKFILPQMVKSSFSGVLPDSRLIGLTDSQTIESDGIKVTGIAAAHEFLDRDDATGNYPYLGFVFEANGCTFYHSGDTCIYEGMIAGLKQWEFDVVFLPINGRDAKRLAGGCIGNMTYQEAVDLAGALAPGLTIPAHFDMFANNMADPGDFTAYMQVKFPALNYHVCDYAECFVYRGQQSLTG